MTTTGSESSTDVSDELEVNYDETSVTGERGRPLTNAEKKQRIKEQQLREQQQQQQHDQQQHVHQQHVQQQPFQQPQKQQQFRGPQKDENSIMRRKHLFFGEHFNPPSWQNILPNRQPAYFPPQAPTRRKNIPPPQQQQQQQQQQPGPNDRIMYSQSPKLTPPNGPMMRGRPLGPPGQVPNVANSRRDFVPPIEPQPIPLSRPNRPYPSFSNYPVPEKGQSLDPQTLHQLSTTSQLEVTTAPTRHYTHFDRLDAVTFDQVTSLISIFDIFHPIIINFHSAILDISFYNNISCHHF